MDSIWELEQKIEGIINKNIKEIPWEGQEVDKIQLRSDILNLILTIPQHLIQNIKKQQKQQ